MTSPSSPSETPPPSHSEPDETPSDEFAKALAEHESAAPAAAEAASGEPAVGQKVKARIVSMTDDVLLVDFGGRSEGSVEGRPFKNEDNTWKVAVGDELDLYVLESGEQTTLGPSLKADAGAALGQLREAMKTRVPVSGKVTAVNSGGLAVDVGGARGFCPLSQIELGFCAEPQSYVGKTLEFLVTEVKDGKGGVVLSRRQLLRKAEESKGKELLAKIQPGDELEGKVARLENFGAFVDLGGLDGLVHVSEISHDRIGHPKEVLKPGQKVRVKVLRIENGKDGKPRVALSIRASMPDPWEGIETRFTPGQRVTGTVARLTDFGAFIALSPGIDGLVHISQVAPHRVGHVKEVLNPGQQVEAVVLSVEPAKKRLALSIRDAMGDVPPARAPVVGEIVEGKVAGIKPFGVFVDLPEFGPRVAGLMPREESGQPRGADLATVFPLGSMVRVEILEPRQGKVRVRLEGATPAAPRAERPPRTERPPRAATGTAPAGDAPAGEAATRTERPPRREGPPRSGEGGGSGRGEGPRGERGRGGDRREGGAGGRSGGPRRERGGGGSGAGGGRSRGERGDRFGSERSDRESPSDRFDHKASDRRDRENSRPFASSSSGEEPPSLMAQALRKAMEEARRKQGGDS